MGTFVIYPKKHAKKGFTIVEVAVVMLVISVLTGLISIMMPGIIEKANRTVDESDIRNLNTATAAYKTLKKNAKGQTYTIDRISIKNYKTCIVISVRAISRAFRDRERRRGRFEVLTIACPCLPIV